MQEVELKIVCVLCHYLQFRAVPCVVCDLELTFALTFTGPHVIIDYVPARGTPGKQRDPGIWRVDSHWYSERRTSMPMKKPIRLLGMVFQIDQ